MENKEAETLAIEKLTLTVKSSTRKEIVEVLMDTNIASLKEIIASKFDVDVDFVRLVYAGRILKDIDTIASLGIKNGSTIYTVIRASSQISDPSPSSNPILTNDLPSSIIPNLIYSQNSSSEALRLVLNNNAALQGVVQRNPELAHMINNPTLLREAIEVMVNPNVASEIMRSADRAMNNIESLPGGFNALRQMYHDIEEPLINASYDTSNPFASLITSVSSSQQGAENREPLPNPWLLNEFAHDEIDLDILAIPTLCHMLEHLQNYDPQSDNPSPEMLEDFRSLIAGARTAYMEDSSLQDQMSDAMHRILSQSLSQPAEHSNLSVEGTDTMTLPAPLLAGVHGNQSNNISTNSLTGANNVSTNNLTNSNNVSQLNTQNISNTSEQFEERYSLQLQQLSGMGFDNPHANLQALIATFGNLNQAIAILLDRNSAS